MSRPLRIEFAGALYHVTARGNRREAIYEDDADRRLFLDVLGDVVERFNWLCHAYCLMTNHYHLMVETPDGNLAKGMRQLNGVYTQKINRRHRRSGHVFQGRYTAVLVDADAHLLELARYVVLNPVRAGMVDAPRAWRWSSYRATAGGAKAPSWLAADALLARFADDRAAAVRRYRRFVAEGGNADSIWTKLNRQVFLGDDGFVARMQALRRHGSPDMAIPPDTAIPRAQQRPPAPPLDAFASRYPDRDAAIAAAHATGAYSYQQIAEVFGLHFTTVGRIVRAARKAGMLR
jgi:REP element-mobilizing transposase RayT